MLLKLKDFEVNYANKIINIMKEKSIRLCLSGQDLSNEYFISEEMKKKMLVIYPLLTKLVMSRNLFTEIPVNFELCEKLLVFHCANNYLTKIPANISSCRFLENLNLAHNELSYFPESMKELTNLTVLNISGNNFEHLPDWMSDLENLSVFNISYNNIKRYPQVVDKMPELRKLLCRGNPFTNIKSYEHAMCYDKWDLFMKNTAKSIKKFNSEPWGNTLSAK